MIDEQIIMGKWSEQVEQRKEMQAKNNTRKEKLAGFFFDLAKLCFGGLVLGNLTPLFIASDSSLKWEGLICGVIATYLLAFSANRILK